MSYRGVSLLQSLCTAASAVCPNELFKTCGFCPYDDAEGSSEAVGMNDEVVGTCGVVGTNDEVAGMCDEMASTCGVLYVATGM